MSIVLSKYFKYALVLLLILSGVFTLFGGYVLWFILPRGIGLHGASYCSANGLGPTGNSVYFASMNRFLWIRIHNWASVALAVLILLHLLLHWKWIVGTTKRIFGNLRQSTAKVHEYYGSVILLFSLFMFEGLSGLVLWLVMPRGKLDHNHMTQGTGRTFLLMQRNTWVNLHAWVAVIMVGIILVHMILNWNWVMGVTKKSFRGAGRPAQ